MMPQAEERVEHALRDASQGSRDAFDEVWNWCEPELHRVCRYRLRVSDIHLGYDNDLLQDISLKFWTEINDHRDKYVAITCEHARCLLLRMASHLAIDHSRHEQREKSTIQTWVKRRGMLGRGAESGIAESEIESIERWNKFFDSLSTEDQELCLLKGRGASIDEIAACLRVSPNTIYRRLTRLRNEYQVPGLCRTVCLSHSTVGSSCSSNLLTERESR